jgi:transposase
VVANVITDNLGGHNAKAVRQLIRIADARFFSLSKYSAELNLIEQIFVRLKHFAARGRRTLCRSWLRRYCPNPRCFYLRRMRKLFPKFKLCANPIAVMHGARTRSRAIKSAWVRARNTLPEKQ